MQKHLATSIRDEVTPAEWDQRVTLAAAYRLVAHFGWDDLIFTHLSARVPGGDDHFLINPYGMTFDEITASSLVKVDLHGRKVTDSPYDINPAGFTIHSAIHAAREDAKCVLHVHSVNGTAVSAQREGLLPAASRWWRSNLVGKFAPNHTPHIKELSSPRPAASAAPASPPPATPPVPARR